MERWYALRSKHRDDIKKEKDGALRAFRKGHEARDHADKHHIAGKVKRDGRGADKFLLREGRCEKKCRADGKKGVGGLGGRNADIAQRQRYGGKQTQTRCDKQNRTSHRGIMFKR